MAVRWDDKTKTFVPVELLQSKQPSLAAYFPTAKKQRVENNENSKSPATAPKPPSKQPALRKTSASAPLGGAKQASLSPHFRISEYEYVPAAPDGFGKPGYSGPTLGFWPILEYGFVDGPPKITKYDGIKPVLWVSSWFVGAGIGDLGLFRGLTELAAQSGMELRILFVVEGDLDTARQAKETLSQIHGKDVPATVFDANPFHFERYPQNMTYIRDLLRNSGYKRARGDRIVLSFTPPCQAASNAGLREVGSEMDSLSYTLPAVVKGLAELGYFVDYAINENVPGLATKFDITTTAMVLTELARRLFDLGYAIRIREIDALTIGSIQSRRRLILEAVRKGFPLPRALAATHAEVADPTRNLLSYETLVTMPPDELPMRADFFPVPFYRSSQVDGAEEYRVVANAKFDTTPRIVTVVPVVDGRTATHLPTAMATYHRFLQTLLQVDGQDNLLALEKWLKMECTNHGQWYTGKRSFKCCGRRNMDCWRTFWGAKRVDSFLGLARRGKLPNYFRAMTIPEFAQLQAFPDALLKVDQWGLEKCYRMIGNAVHVGLFTAIGRNIADAVSCANANKFPKPGEEHFCDSCLDLRTRLLAGEMEAELELGARNVYVEGEGKVPEWFDLDKCKKLKEKAEVAPTLAYLVPKEYSFP